MNYTYTMTEEEKSQMVGRYAHHWCDFLYKIMDEITHKDVINFLQHEEIELQKHLTEPDNSQHWIFEVRDGFCYKGSEKPIPMVVAYYGPMHVRANTQNILECIIRLARWSKSSPQEVSKQIVEFKYKMGDYRELREEGEGEIKDPPAPPSVVAPKTDPLAGLNKKK